MDKICAASHKNKHVIKSIIAVKKKVINFLLREYLVK